MSAAISQPPEAASAGNPSVTKGSSPDKVRRATLLSILTSTSASRVFLSLLLGSLAGAAYALLIPLVTSTLTGGVGLEQARQVPYRFLSLEVSNHRLAALYVVACLLIFAGRTVSQVMLTWVVIDATSALRKRYFQRIFDATLASSEQVGTARLLASITTDVQRIVNGVQLIPDVLISTVTVLGMLLFLLYLDASIFRFVCGAILFATITFQIPIILARRFFERAREQSDALHDAIAASVHGAKELKLCAQRRTHFIREVLLRAEAAVRSSSKRGATIVRAATNYGDMASFFIIGYVAYVFVNYNAVDTTELIGALMVLLYITGPLSIMMNTAPEIVQGGISLSKVDALFRELPEEDIARTVTPLGSWSRLCFHDVRYRYVVPEGADEGGFTIGPLNLELRRGEITFIVGGNGSGKSTLAKLITGHYLPTDGEIRLDERPIDRELVNSYRDCVSAIFTDYHLFPRLLGTTATRSSADVDAYLRMLGLDGKVRVQGGRFSTLALSDGQRKRLALLVAFLEDKDLYLFDEWAADQDPLFKDVFYHRILPDLKLRNKVVVVISHDDRYFRVGDRILTMEQGLLQGSAGHHVQPAHAALNEPSQTTP